MEANGTSVKIAVVIPLFNEEEILAELVERLTRTLDNIGCDWTVHMVDDGSRDRTPFMLEDLKRRDSRFRVLTMARNFGHQAAFTAGLMDVDADAVVTMDGDLQDPPEVIPLLLDAWKAGAEIVLARRRQRAETGWRGLALRTFHKTFRWLVDFPIPADVGTFGLMCRTATRALLKLPERHRFLPGLRAWIGFKVETVEYDRQLRGGGLPKMGFARLLRYALDGLFSFSTLPLRVVSWAGFTFSGGGVLLALFFVIKRLLGLETAVTGFTTLVTLISILGGLQLVALGVLGEYVGRIYDEVKRRPLFILRDDESP